MKTCKHMVIALLLCLSAFTSQAQSDTAIATEKAFYYADSMVRSAFYQDWNAYINLSNYSAVKYYGGKDGYRDHVITMYFHSDHSLEEKPETLKLMTILNDGDQWQCVLEKVRSTFIDNRKVRIYSYLVGQSKDAGETWRFVDISYNSIKNVIYIFPEVFGTLAIPEGKLIYEDEELAALQAAEAAKNAPKKKAAPKKRK